MSIQYQFQDDEYIDATFEYDDAAQASVDIAEIGAGIERERVEDATRLVFPRTDTAYDNEAKSNPDQVFQLLVGDMTLQNCYFRATAMRLDEQEEEAIRGLHLAEAFDCYADMHHLNRLPGAPSRKTSMTDMRKGEAFWLGFQNAKGVSISRTGERSRLGGHQRVQHWQRAVALDADLAKQGHNFFTASRRPADDIFSMSDILAEIRRDGVAGGRTGGVSAYTEEVAAVVSAIHQKDKGFFVPSRRAAKGPAHKVRTAQRQRTR